MSDNMPWNPVTDDRVMSLREFSERVGISMPTLRRLIAANEGPVITSLSERRRGVRLRHANAWLDARANGAPSQSGDRNSSGREADADH